ncbi:MAG: primosomal protein N' [Chlorobi bacterium]|nr:primosomal protein N' [Chlorobiota bacterium]
MATLFADVILPLPLHDYFTYRVPPPFEKKIHAGQRVIVQFGKKKFYSALVTAIHNKPPEGFEVKDIHSILDEEAVIFPQNIDLWKWIAEYYCCTLGDVMRAAFPSGMKMESQTKVAAIGEVDEASLSEAEMVIFRNLRERPIAIHELQKKLGRYFSFTGLKSLIGKKVISVEEEIAAKYKPKSEPFISIHPDIKTEAVLNEKIESLGRAKKQKELLLHFCKLAGPFSKNEIKELSRKELFKEAGFSVAILKGLVSKKILKVHLRTISRLTAPRVEQGGLYLLNPFQEEALAKVKREFANKQVVLLHGVTSSGKTELYSHLIEEAIKKGQQVLYLVPEIALTTQITSRLKRYFGAKVGVFHSKMSDHERVEIWEKVLGFYNRREGSYQIILGARSSLFLPFSNLGLIVVDEEHENSYKQFDPAPRYNARDMAVVLGYQNKAKVLLGSATPSFESYFNAKAGKFGLVELEKRHGEMEMPEIIVADIRRAYKRKEMKSFLTPALFERVETALEKRQQVILFQNRRGYAPFIECMNCGWIPKCEKCDVSLTYHKFKKQLTCHYCGFYLKMPENCHDCGSPDIKTRGMGTEKIEDELKQLFPTARIARMDLDSTRSRTAFEKLVYNLENRKTDILVGTQMVTKGLDFDYVSVVGILNADNLINFPDFRAHERSYQLIAQVSGRAGRKHKQGSVVIQTSQPDHPIIAEIMENAYLQTFSRQLNERKFFKYPPYFRLIKVVVKHKDIAKVSRASSQLATKLRDKNYFIVLGPEFPLVSRIKNWHQKEIWLKIDRAGQLAESKKYLVQCVHFVKHLPGNSGAIFNIDVDPM